MAVIEQEIRSFVLSRADISAAIGERFHWNKVPDSPGYPYVKAVTIADVPSYHQQGEGAGKITVQLDVIDQDELECLTTADTIRNALSGYTGAMGSRNVRMFVRNVPNFWEPDARVYRKVLEMEIGYV